MSDTKAVLIMFGAFITLALTAAIGLLSKGVASCIFVAIGMWLVGSGAGSGSDHYYE